MKGFGSDNHASIHPEILKSIQDSNSGHAPSYGTDNESTEAISLFREAFGQNTEVFFVFNGTAANVLALRFAVARHQSIICSDVSHLHLDECGAPEFFAGKLITVKTFDGKMRLEDIKSQFIRAGDQHFSQPRVVSLTQPTELGTCYTTAEIKEICSWAHQHNILVHLDGARISNALVELNCSYKEMTTDLGIDLVSFGGTKNGLMMGEAILVLGEQNSGRARDELKYIRKQCAQLPSKTRYIACQFKSYLSNELYFRIARHSCNLAERLFQGLSKIPEVKVTATRQSNAVFCIFPKTWIKKLKEQAFFYVWDEKTFECRLMLSWDSTEAEVDDFISLARSLSERS